MKDTSQIRHLSFIYLIFILLGINAAAIAENGLKNELDSGRVVVLIVGAEKSEHSRSEQYADWAYYLNQFSINVGVAYAFHKVSKNDLKNLIHDSKSYSQNYSMIFIKKGKPDFFYNGPILEPQVYQYVQLVYADKPVEPEYLNQFAPQKVDIKFR